MTAPTHPEPRPDDEGREPGTPAMLRYLVETVEGRARLIADREELSDGASWLIVALAKHCNALTPHPAPLGATAGPTAEQIEALVAAGREATPYVQTYMSAGAASTVGATDEELRPVKWEAVGGEAHDRVYIEEAEQRDGTRLYAVRWTGSVLGRDGEWLIMEPLPSSRDEAYIAAYRFATIPDAVSALRAALQAETDR